jgi:maltose/moltooligosaccharide transporter
MKKPKLSTAQIWNMSMGFMGIQFGFALQNANASRILQNFGADIESLSWFWLAAPITGLIVQPIIGHYSDQTWTRFGRRKPFFLTGALLAAIALCIMPNAGVLAVALPPLMIGAGMLMIMDASFNIAMEPFRALVGDMLPEEQNTTGFSIQATLIGIGAVVGSWLPYILVNFFGVSQSALPGEVPDNVVYSFYFGAVVLVGAILWTVIKTKEYSPAELQSFNSQEVVETQGGLMNIFTSFKQMPETMKQLGWVQFFSWFGLFCMWVYSTPAIAQHIYGTDIEDSSSSLFNEAGNWVGIIFGVYNAVSAGFALLLPIIAKKIGKKQAHSIALTAGGLGLLSIYFVQDPIMLILSMAFVGMAWASILSMPYALLAGTIPLTKMGIYMGIFNFFIVVPQIVSGIIGGPIVKNLFDSQAIFALMMGGVSLLIAAVFAMFVVEKETAEVT